MVTYEVAGEEKACQDLCRVIGTHKEYVQTTTKGPLIPHTEDSKIGKLIGEDKQKVNKYVVEPALVVT